ncbi:MAG: hypothetical protein ACYDC2_08745 [Solirubrobacteraceae bacterium]
MAERRHTAAAAEQDERVRRITDLAQRLLTDLARHGCGDPPDLPYLVPTCAAAVHAALAASGADGWSVEADYGEAVSGTAHLSDTGGAVAVAIVVDDRSVARDVGGAPVALPPARWRLELALDSRCTRITGLRVVAG